MLIFVSSLSIYRKIRLSTCRLERVSPSTPWHSRVMHEDTERQLRCIKYRIRIDRFFCLSVCYRSQFNSPTIFNVIPKHTSFSGGGPFKTVERLEALLRCLSTACPTANCTYCTTAVVPQCPFTSTTKPPIKKEACPVRAEAYNEWERTGCSANGWFTSYSIICMEISLALSDVSCSGWHFNHIHSPHSFNAIC